MEESTITGTCGSCRKSFKVPRPDRKYRCKSCGGVVSVQSQATSAPRRMASTGVKCDDCGATNSESARFCAECGESLDIGAPHSSKERKRRAKGEASVELKRARKVIRVVRLSFGFNIVLYALYLLFVYQGLMGVDLGSLELPVWILLAVVTCMLALSVVAFIRVKLHPFTWAILLASLSTAERIFQIFTDGALYISIAWTIGLWLLVPATAKVRRIMRSTPDHYGVQAMQGTT
ncbi:MAG: hypothetical protein ACI9K5_001503, partial [Gammaproteobacteria bacterium]